MMMNVNDHNTELNTVCLTVICQYHAMLCIAQ